MEEEEVFATAKAEKTRMGLVIKENLERLPRFRIMEWYGKNLIGVGLIEYDEDSEEEFKTNVWSKLQDNSFCKQELASIENTVSDASNSMSDTTS